MKILHLLAVGAALGLVPPVSATVKTENRNANISTPGITQVTKDLITDFESLLIDHGSSADIFSVPRTEAGIYLQDNGDQYVAKKLSVRAPESIPQWKPYLQVPTANSIFVTWRANGHKAVVKLGDTPSALSRTITGSSQMLSDATTTFEYHKVFVDGLQPDTKYYYQITGDPEIYSFRTQPAIGSKRNYRVLILGDHQKLDRSGYEWLINAAKETVNKKYGKWEDEIDIVLNPGDQVNVGTYSYYERCHFFKSYGISPYLPIMTTLGNHEMKEDADLQKYSNIFQYEKLAYQGISSGNDLYYAIQEGRTLFVFLCTEAPYTNDEQINWLKQVLDAATKDESVDFVMSMCHRPMCSETYTNDYSPWLQQTAVPVLGTCPKHVLNVAAHHHYYQRGHVTDYPFFHIISGGASWDQTWEIAPTKEDLNEVQKTLDYWTYQIINFNPESKSMEVETYSIGNKNIVHNNILIDSFTRDLSDLSKPAKPELAELPEMVTLPATIRTSDYQSPKGDDFNSCQFQISTSSLFKNCMFDKIRHFENLYEDEGAPYYIPVDTQKGKSALSLVLEENSLSGGIYYIRVRHRNKNAQWSDWSDTRSFVVIGDETTEPGISLEKNIYKLREPISIAFKNAPVGTKAWIGVYKHGTPTDGSIKSLKWAYTEGKDGSIKINGLAAGVYFAVLYADGGYIQISDKHPILVTNQDAGTLSVDRSVYGVGDEVKVEFANTPGYEKDWVGIYRVNDKYAPGPGSYKSSVYEYVPVGTTAGKASFKNASKLTEGDYFAGFFLKGGYEEVTPRSYFRIGAPAVLSIPEKQFNDHEYVPFMLVGKPLFPDVYLVITDAVTKTVVDKVRLGNTLSELGVVRQFPKGEYHAEVRIGDRQEPVSNAITFRVETGAGLSETVTGKVSAYPNPVADVLTLTGIKADRAELYALDGRLVRVYTAITDNKISLQSVDPGNYELLVIAGNKRTTFQVIRK